MKQLCGRAVVKRREISRGHLGLESLEPRMMLSAAHTASSMPTIPFEFNGSLFFIADDGIHGRELFTTDGSAGGTKLVKDIAPGDGDGVEYTFTIDDELYVIGAAGMWRTDGTALGTQQVLDRADWMDSIIVGPQVGENRWFDVVYGSQRGLWKTDGTVDGTGLVNVFNYYVNFLGQTNGSVVYMANDYSADQYARGEYHFFASGGSAGAATQLMDESVYHSESSRISAIIDSARTYQSQLYFQIPPPTGSAPATWWKTDGTSNGTAITTAPPAEPLLSHGGTVAGSKAYFFQNPGGKTELWITDGTDTGTRKVRTVGVNPIGSFGGSDGTFYFFANVGGVNQVWRSDGTTDGTNKVADLPPVLLNGPPMFGGVFDGTLYFAANDGVHGWEMWTADAGGSRMVLDLNQSLTAVQPPTLYCAELVGATSNEVATARPTFLIRDYEDQTVGAIYVDGVEVMRKAVPGFAEMTLTQPLAPGEHTIVAAIGGADGVMAAQSSPLKIVVTVSEPIPTSPPPFLTSGTLQIAGTDDDDSILVYRRKSKPSMLDVNVNGVMATFRLKGMSRILITGGDGNDTIRLDESNGAITVAAKIYGGAGNDVIASGSGDDRIIGGDGNDWINAGAGRDSIFGEAGNDRLFGDAGSDYIVAGGGTNLIRGGGSVDRIIATIGLDDLKGNRGDRIIAPG